MEDRVLIKENRSEMLSKSELYCKLYIDIYDMILYSNKWIRRGFTKLHFITYIDYLHLNDLNKSTNWKIFNKCAKSLITLNC